MNKAHRLTAEGLILLSFLAAIVIGTLMLKMPFVIREGIASLTLIDAVFMATSAVCVTGLSLFDIGRNFTFTGQMVILGLIQIGGLGIMTFSLLFALILGSKTSLNSRFSISELSRDFDRWSIKRALVSVLVLTLLFECLGSGLLFWKFRQMYPFKQALFFSVFHAISAFCNAGFSLFSDSLAQFQNDPYILFIIMGLIVFGGLGFTVLKELSAYIKSAVTRQKFFQLSLHTKVALSGSFLFLLIGTLVIWQLECRNAFSSFPVNKQIIQALFLSVTSRTAGFNTITTGLLSNATLFFIVMLMFVGGCPGSTAGGIKVHTFITLFQLILAKIKRRKSPSLFARSISINTVDKSLAIFAVAFITLSLITLLLQVSEDINISHTTSGGSFLDLLFEAGSAFGTVGLSTGVTARLSSWGKIFIIFLMLAGRVGPITLGVALFRKRKKQASFEYIQEDFMIA